MNIVAVIIKDTSLLMWITILELTHQTQQVNIKKFEPVTAFVTGAIIYFALFSFVQIINKIHRKGLTKHI